MSPLAFQETWSDERAARVAQRVQRRLMQRRRLGGVVVGLAVLAAALGGALALRSGTPPPAPGVVQLGDGSTAFAVGRLTALRDTADEVRLRLDEGAASFDVVKRPGRRFLVEVPPAVVEVVGTRFGLSTDGTTLQVRVTEGRVWVTVASERTELTAGQASAFALRGVAASAAPEPAAPPLPIAAPGAPDWRPLAHRGEFDQAWPLLKAVRDEPKDLLLASDVARHSGHPRVARRYLEQLLDRHPTDARAPLAAFTLGRLLLEDLGWPRDAAQAFVRARALDPAGPLAEDALAREVESWSRAGDSDRAHAAAVEYLQKYPRGQRAAGVRRYGGL